MLMAWIVASTPLMHLLRPAIDAILFPNIDGSKKQKKVFVKLDLIEKRNNKINQLQNKQIQENKGKIDTKMAVLDLMSLIHAYTKIDANYILTIIYEMMEEHIETLI